MEASRGRKRRNWGGPGRRGKWLCAAAWGGQIEEWAEGRMGGRGWAPARMATRERGGARGNCQTEAGGYDTSYASCRHATHGALDKKRYDLVIRHLQLSAPPELLLSKYINYLSYNICFHLLL